MLQQITFVSEIFASYYIVRPKYDKWQHSQRLKVLWANFMGGYNILSNNPKGIWNLGTKEFGINLYIKWNKIKIIMSFN